MIESTADYLIFLEKRKGFKMADIQPDDERRLLAQLAQGDEHAFTAIYKLYSARLHSNIFRLVKCEDTAKELLQDLFLKIWEMRHNIDPDKSFKSFLYKIAENLVYDHFRAVSRDKKLAAKLIESALTHYTDPEEALYYTESLNMVQAAVDQLPPARRQVYILNKFEGKSYEEISAQLGISQSTISDHMVKANRFIKGYLYKKTDIAFVFGLLCASL